MRASARAIPMRWRWPPENSCGYRFVKLGLKPTTSSSSRMRMPRSRRVPIPCTISGSPTMSPTVMRGSSDEYGSWKTICISRRILRSSSRPSSVNSMPSKRIEPDVGFMSWRTQ